MKNKYLMENMWPEETGDKSIGQMIPLCVGLHMFVTSDLSKTTKTFIDQMVEKMKAMDGSVLRFVLKRAGDIDTICAEIESFIARTGEDPTVVIDYMMHIDKDTMNVAKLKKVQSDHGLQVIIAIYSSSTGVVYTRKIDELIYVSDVIWTLQDRGIRDRKPNFELVCLKDKLGNAGEESMFFVYDPINDVFD